jgi:hypothetical protein
VKEGKHHDLTLRRRRGRFIGHILRHSGLLKTVLEGEISGKNYRERPRMEYIGQMMKDVQIKKLCRDEKTGGEQRKQESCYKPILGLMIYDDIINLILITGFRYFRGNAQYQCTNAEVQCARTYIPFPAACIKK